MRRPQYATELLLTIHFFRYTYIHTILLLLLLLLVVLGLEEAHSHKLVLGGNINFTSVGVVFSIRQDGTGLCATVIRSSWQACVEEDRGRTRQNSDKLKISCCCWDAGSSSSIIRISFQYNSKLIKKPQAT